MDLKILKLWSKETLSKKLFIPTKKPLFVIKILTIDQKLVFLI